MASSVWVPDLPIYDRLAHAHLPGLVLTLGAIISLIGFASSPKVSHAEHEPSEDPWFTAAIVLYTFAMIEALLVPFCTQGTLKHLCNKHHSDHEEHEHEVFDRMRQSRPRFKMSIECFHHERRHRWVSESYTDSEGQQRTRQKRESYQEKVVTFRTSQYKDYSCWVDLSGPGHRLGDLGSDCVGVMVTINKLVEPNCEETARDLSEQARRFREAHAYRDVEHSFSESTELDHFQSSVFLHSDHLPWFASWPVYVLASLALLSWPYRLLLQRYLVGTTWQLRSKVSTVPGALGVAETALA
jgi:hypothetical protein